MVLGVGVRLALASRGRDAVIMSTYVSLAKCPVQRKAVHSLSIDSARHNRQVSVARGCHVVDLQWHLPNIGKNGRRTPPSFNVLSVETGEEAESCIATLWLVAERPSIAVSTFVRDPGKLVHSHVGSAAWASSSHPRDLLRTGFHLVHVSLILATANDGDVDEAATLSK